MSTVLTYKKSVLSQKTISIIKINKYISISIVLQYLLRNTKKLKIQEEF